MARHLQHTPNYHNYPSMRTRFLLDGICQHTPLALLPTVITGVRRNGVTGNSYLAPPWHSPQFVGRACQSLRACRARAKERHAIPERAVLV